MLGCSAGVPDDLVSLRNKISVLRPNAMQPRRCAPFLLCGHVASLANVQAAQLICSEDEHMLDFAYGPDAQPADVHERSLLPMLRKLVEGYNTAAILFGASGMSGCCCLPLSSGVEKPCDGPQHVSVPAAVFSAQGRLCAGTGKSFLLEGEPASSLSPAGAPLLGPQAAGGFMHLASESLFELLSAKQAAIGERTMQARNSWNCLEALRPMALNDAACEPALSASLLPCRPESRRPAQGVPGQGL